MFKHGDDVYYERTPGEYGIAKVVGIAKDERTGQDMVTVMDYVQSPDQDHKVAR